MSTYTASDYSAFALRVASGALFIAHGLTNPSVTTVTSSLGLWLASGARVCQAYAGCGT